MERHQSAPTVWNTTRSLKSETGRRSTQATLPETRAAHVESLQSTRPNNRMLTMDTRSISHLNTVIIQQNLGRKQQAQNQLLSYLINNTVPVAVVQEPYTIDNVVPTNSPYKVISCDPDSGRPRAAIFVSSHVHVLHLSQFTSRDLCACTITFHRVSIKTKTLLNWTKF